MSQSGTTSRTTRALGHGNRRIRTGAGISSKISKHATDSRRTDPVEQTCSWRDLGPANVDPAPADGPSCPTAHSRTMSKHDQQQYVRWICEVLQIDRKTSKDERVYCSHCDATNHPRFSCKFYYKRQDERSKHQCTLCMAKHAPFQCARAQVNGGVAKPHWARREKKLAVDQNREPDLRWDREGNLPPPPLPPPVEAPPQEQTAAGSSKKISNFVQQQS